MCITFLAISDNPQEDGYKVIIASNRDERFERPTKEAHFWEDHPHILSGKDTDHEEGSTWLGITRHGKIGILTNYRQHPSFRSKHASSRGELVVNYLKSNDNVKPSEYIEEVKLSGKSYNGFNVIVGDILTDGSSQFSYYCNQEHKPMVELKSGIYGLSNRYLDYEWKKVTLGKDKFKNIIKQRCPTEEKINLLLELLQDKTRYLIDDQFLGPCDEGIPRTFLEACTATSVFVPLGNNTWYGTRTHTIIIVDAQNDVTFVEKTMKEPINVENIHWNTNTFQFKIHSKQ